MTTDQLYEAWGTNEDGQLVQLAAHATLEIAIAAVESWTGQPAGEPAFEQKAWGVSWGTQSGGLIMSQYEETQ